jgi:hypothetical protein
LHRDIGKDRSVATTAKQTAPEIIYLSEEEGRAAFDEAARRLAGMSRDEFIRISICRAGCFPLSAELTGVQ